MRVEHDVKLTFDDVLIRPKRSTLVSRSDVTLVRDFKFRHSDTTWTGVPIVLCKHGYYRGFRSIKDSSKPQDADLPAEILLHQTVFRRMG